MHQVVIVRRGETARLSLLRGNVHRGDRRHLDRRFVDRRQHPERRVPGQAAARPTGPAASQLDRPGLSDLRDTGRLPAPGGRERIGPLASSDRRRRVDGERCTPEVHTRSAGFPSRPVPSSPRTVPPSNTPFELVQASGVNLWHTEHRGRLGLSGAPRSGLDPELDAGTIGESTAERCGRKSASRI